MAGESETTMKNHNEGNYCSKNAQTVSVIL